MYSPVAARPAAPSEPDQCRQAKFKFRGQIPDQISYVGVASIQSEMKVMMVVFEKYKCKGKSW